MPNEKGLVICFTIGYLPPIGYVHLQLKENVERRRKNILQTVCEWSLLFPKRKYEKHPKVIKVHAHTLKNKRNNIYSPLSTHPLSIYRMPTVSSYFDSHVYEEMRRRRNKKCNKIKDQKVQLNTCIMAIKNDISSLQVSIGHGSETELK
jgi:hypothetical protein